MNLYVETYLLSNVYKWTTLIQTTKFKYNPIDNYDGEETETLTITKTGSDTNTGNAKIGEQTTQYQTAPYNVPPVNTDNTLQGAQENTSSSTTTYDTTDKHVKEFKRHGNMGTTSTQSMIREEREVGNYNIAKMLAHDIANSISISVYGCGD